MSRTKLLLSSLAFAFFAAATIAAQTPLQALSPLAQPSPSDPETEARTKRHEADVKKAFAELEEAVGQATALRRAGNRARVEMLAAETLWSHDESRARSLYREAMENFNALFGEIDLAHPQYQMRLQPLEQLRSEILNSLANCDPKLALELLRATRPPAWSPSAQNYKYTMGAQIKSNVLFMVATKDPQQAVSAVKEMLKSGVS